MNCPAGIPSAALAARILQRGAIAHSERAQGAVPVTANRIAVKLGGTGITVDTANSLQGPVKFPDGWEANQAMLAHLSQWTVRAR